MISLDTEGSQHPAGGTQEHRRKANTRKNPPALYVDKKSKVEPNDDANDRSMRSPLNYSINIDRKIDNQLRE